MENYHVAWALQELADLLDLTGESPFKSRAYRIAARRIESLTDDLAELYREGRLTEIDGIGKSIAQQIGEYLETGTISLAQQLKAELPAGLFSILTVPGLGPRRVGQLYAELGITSLAELEQAAKERRIRRLKGLGVKVEDAILAGIARIANSESSGRMLLNMASEQAAILRERLARHPLVSAVEIAGSLRRRVETIGDLDLVAATAEPHKVGEFFKSFPESVEIIADGPTKLSAIHRSGFQVDLRLVTAEQFASAWLHFTGSKAHNIRLRQLAKAAGFRLSEYGLENLVDGSVTTVETEAELYARLGLPFIEPELREDRGEIEAAQAGTLPKLVTRAQIRGDLHMHSNWSDGTATIAQMARAAAKLGYEYIAICDHSQSLKVAHGLDWERLQAQHREIRELNRQGDLGLKILTGIEVDILADRLDFPDEVLAQIDVVVASIHSGFRQSQEQIMARIEMAMRNPHVDILAHPTGRLLNRRDGYAVDIERIIDLAVETGTVLEINSFPDRLDLNDLTARKALQKGATIVINTDAHHSEQLAYMDFGVGVARRAWAESHQILNCLDYQSLLQRLNR
ncbi:MAG: DNA polymerase/3'-5' exonuclease PolX [Firmicutes bacterium]|nr:DNA polymerase/3'-5' exonuclease PolX [Bacillota bacterium]